MLEEIVVYTVVATLLLVLTDGVELVEREYRHVAERHLTLLVALNELAVEAQRGTSCCQTQHKWGQLLVDVTCRGVVAVRTHKTADEVCHILHAVILALENFSRDTLVAVYDIPRRRLLYKSTILW